MMHFDMRNQDDGAEIQNVIGQHEAAKQKEGDPWATEHS
jgi:hypothetical protein